jgi:phosphatidylserine/phosphatidylglycerophosphate/cardiolipin synthase-like enzyme
MQAQRLTVSMTTPDAPNSLTGPEITSLRCLMTASEAYPALERAFLAAETEISASFLVFDLDTKLRSPEALGLGETWFHLIVDTLRRGVRLRFVLSDFDPVARPEMHSGSWRSLRQFLAAAELAGPAARLEITAALHPAQTGILPRLLLWPLIQFRLYQMAKTLNALPPEEREAVLRDQPAMARRLRPTGPNGVLRPNWAALHRLYPGTHHQKLAVIDRKQLYIGGLDLNERRYDDLRHSRPSAETWHDVQLLVEGTVAETAARHLETFLTTVGGRQRPAPRNAEVKSAFVTTLSRRRAGNIAHIGPKTIASTLYQRHVSAIARSKDLIYLETQYFRHASLARALARHARRNPDLSLILMLPGAPEELVFENRRGLDTRLGEWHQARCLRLLQRGFGPRLFIGAAALPEKGHATTLDARDQLSGAPLIYIHAKVSIFDGREAIVSSANLNGRSFRWDTEAGLHLTEASQVAGLRQRAMAHWLPEGAGEAFFAGPTAVTRWRGLALSNAARPPEARQGFVLPYDLRAAEAFGAPLPFVPAEMV